MAVGLGPKLGVRVAVGVRVGVGVKVNMGVRVGVGVKVGVGVGPPPGWSSNAPTSHPALCGLDTPRWSVAGVGGQPVVPVSIAGLPAVSAMVMVGPPLLANS